MICRLHRIFTFALWLRWCIPDGEKSRLVCHSAFSFGIVRVRIWLDCLDTILIVGGVLSYGAKDLVNTRSDLGRAFYHQGVEVLIDFSEVYT